MITKENLIIAKESINPALLKLKQSYSNSSTSKKLFFIVEGKDDIPFYGTKAEDVISNEWKISIIQANNRNNVIKVYNDIDWSLYNKNKVYFFVDRDLTDYTKESTPVDSNIYITDKYSIENDICTYDTLIKTLKYYYSLNDIDENDENIIKQLYDDLFNSFSTFAETIMAQILYWKINNISSNYSNFKLQKLFDIRENKFQVKPEFTSENKTIKELCKQSGVEFSMIDISYYKMLLNKDHEFSEYVRGKYLLVFWVMLLKYISQHSDTILPSKIKSKDVIGVGYESVVARLCGIMCLPKSLRNFFNDINDKLII